MLLETLSPLIVAPILGKSIFIWAAMLCLSIGFLALGYFMGARFVTVDRKSNFINKIFSISGISIFIGLVLLSLQNGSQIELTSPTFTWAIVGFTLCIPLSLFGSTTPVIIDILKKQHSAPDSIAGRVYSISTFGGILFSIFSGFILIPSIGVRMSIFIGLVLTLFFPIIRFLNDGQRMKALIGVIVLIFSLVLTKGSEVLLHTDKVTIQYFEEGLNGQLLVVDQKEDTYTSRKLYINRLGQTNINVENRSSLWPYTNYIVSAATVFPENSKTLVLGLGGGTVPRLIHQIAGHKVDAVELDQRIIELGYDYFHLRASEVSVFENDARRYVKSCQKKYDLIVIDVYNGEIIPSHVLSADAFIDMKKILNPNGLIIINSNGFLTGKKGMAGKSILKTAESVGFKYNVFDASMGLNSEAERNLLFFLYAKKPEWNKTRIHAIINGEEYHLNDHFMESKYLNLNDGIVITDDFPLMEYINHEAASTWRSDYFKTFSKKMNEEYGLPYIR